MFDFSGARLGDGAAVTAPGVVLNLGEASDAAAAARERALEDRIEKKLKQPEYLSYKMEMLAYKLSWVLVPLSVAILALLLAFKRGFTLYDHAVVSLYGLGFVGLLVTLLMVLDGAFPVWVEVVLGVAVGVHAVFHLKGAYGLSRAGAVLRAVPLLVLNVAGFVAFVLAVAALGILG